MHERNKEIKRLYIKEKLSHRKIGKIVGLSHYRVGVILGSLDVVARPKGVSGEAHYNYIDGTASRAYRKHKKSCCEKCGSVARLSVHHKKNGHLNNKPSNLQTLCSSCHARLHAKARPKKTHCINGHEFNKENTYVTSKGYRVCRTCRDERVKIWHELWGPLNIIMSNR